MVFTRLKKWLCGGNLPVDDTVVILIPDRKSLTTAKELIDALCTSDLRASISLLPGFELEPGEAEASLHSPPLSYLAQTTLNVLRARVLLTLNPTKLSIGHKRLLKGSKKRGIAVYTWQSDKPDHLHAVAHGTSKTASPTELALHLVKAIGQQRKSQTFIDRAAGFLQRKNIHRFSERFLSRIDSLEELRQSLDQPQRLLCIGNGPSSMDPRLAGLEYDSLFRVNHMWQSNDGLNQPDLVFPGVKRSMRRLKQTPLALATKAKEKDLIAARLFEPWHGPVTYSIVADLITLPNVEDALQPTSGAYMLALAASLNPSVLIISGMDMFQHPEGAYASASLAKNAYTPAHSRDTDAAFILRALQEFEGKVVCLSPALYKVLSADTENVRYKLYENPI